MTLAKKLKSQGVKKQKPSMSNGPLWKGPEQDGVTQSMLSRFLCCPERFRLLVIEGLRPAPEFSQRMDYGTMWHVCEEHHEEDWIVPLREYCRDLMVKYPTQGQEIDKWYNVCKTQFPIYLEYWAEHADVKQRKVLLPEQVFSVHYDLPSGRCVRLRGRWDSVDLIGRGKGSGIYLQENKTKGDIVEEQMKRQLQFDLQTMFYLTALWEDDVSLEKSAPIRGVRYNVIRRPLAGGTGSIRPHQATKTKEAETMADFYARLGSIIREQPEHFFMRWRAEILPSDVERFKREFLDPTLERLWDWWEWIVADPDAPFRPNEHGIHYRYPYGVWNPLLEGRSSELDEYLATGSRTGLVKADKLFGELG
jgi:hypothetical protein